MKWLTALAKIRHQTLVSRMQTCSTINQQQHDISFIDCNPRLICHSGVNTQFLTTDTTGINNDEGCITYLPLTVLPISSEA
jgi:hypothetical protein